MYKVIKSFLFTSIVFLALFVVSVDSVNAQGPLGEILNRMDKHNKSLNYLKTGVTMVKSDAALGAAGDDVSVGEAQYIPERVAGKMYVRLDWSKPAVEHMVLVGDNYKIYRPGAGTAYIGSRKKATKDNSDVAGPLSFLSMSKDELKRNYKVQIIGEEKIKDGTGTIHLLLTPLTANKYKSVDLWIDADGMPRQSKITSQNGDSTSVFLSGAVKNPKPNYKAFELDIPKNITPVKG